MRIILGERGQTVLETSIYGLLFSGVMFFAFAITLNIMARTFLTRWANLNSRCIATINDVEECRQKTRDQLQRYFGIKHLSVEAWTRQGVIHSELRAPFIGRREIVAHFDLQPSEYKRVK